MAHAEFPAAALHAVSYAFLAQAFRPPGRALLEVLVSKQNEKAWGQLAELSPSPELGILATLARDQARVGLADPELLGRMAQEHASLFSNPYHVAAPPYESFYASGEGLLMREAAAAVLGAYERAGLVLACHWRDLPDHVVAELEFMACLCLKEAAGAAHGRDKEVRGWALHQHRFVSQHLGRWLPSLRQRIEATHAGSFYHVVARVAEALVLSHGETLSLRVRGPRDA